jgi:hypothetical protein
MPQTYNARHIFNVYRGDFHGNKANLVKPRALNVHDFLLTNLAKNSIGQHGFIISRIFIFPFGKKSFDVALSDGKQSTENCLPSV